MAEAKEREFREDAEGVRRLVAAPGDEIPAKDEVAVGPVRVANIDTPWNPEEHVEVEGGVKSAIPPEQKAADEAVEKSNERAQRRRQDS